MRNAIALLILTIVTVVLGIIGMPLILTGSRRIVSYIPHAWGKINLFLFKHLLGLDYKIIGENNIPKDKPVILACKHQSAWETVFLIAYFRSVSIILKKELCYIPIYGWYLPFIAICIKRGTIASIKQVARESKKQLQNGNSLFVFPEGTRVAYGEDGEVKPGIYFIHKENPDVPIIPVALNSGKFWKKGSFNIQPGTVAIKFLKPLTGKYKKAELIEKLQTSLNEESNKL